MKSKFWVLTAILLFVIVFISGCGNSEKGTYAIINPYSIKYFKVDVADNGNYLLKQGGFDYKVENPSEFDTAVFLKKHSTKDNYNDIIHNFDEAFEKINTHIKSNIEFLPGGGIKKIPHWKWNGTTLKLERHYLYEEYELKETFTIPKSAIAFKDSNLIFDGKTYKKTDESSLVKEVARLKENVKSKLGKEFVLKSKMDTDQDNIKAVIAKIVINKIKNGKRIEDKEVFEIEGALKENANKANDKANVKPNSSSVTTATAPSKENSEQASEKSTYPAITKAAYINAYESSADNENGYIHSAKLTIDGNTSTCWSEGVKGLGVGENIEIHFNGNYKIAGLDIWIGHQKSQDIYKMNARPTALRIEGSDGSSDIYNLQDKFGSQRVTFKKPITVNKVKLIIERVTPGNKYEDTCISEVNFF